MYRSIQTCYCPAYLFPHREGGGKCSGSGSFCCTCGADDEGHEVDFGIGSYECHGYRGIDKQLALVSHCCEASIMDRNWQEISL